MTELKDGFYKFNQEVTNPHPDRRSTRMDCKPVWPAGTRVRILGAAVEDRHAQLRFYDGTYLHVTNQESLRAERGFIHEDVFVSALAPTPDNLGIILRREQAEAQDILAYMVEMGQIGLDVINRAAKHVMDLSEEDFNNLRKKHWL